MTHKPVLALTTGDPAGIGPEISLRVAADRSLRDLCRLILIGDASALESIRPISKVDDAILAFPPDQIESVLGNQPHDGVVELLDCGVLPQAIPLAMPGEQGGAASFAYIRTAIELARAGMLDGVVTAPVNKLAWSLAGVTHPGHTEAFAEYTNSQRVAMLMYSDKLAVGLVTCHQSLATVPDALTVEGIVATGELLHESMEKIRGRKPRLGVLGLNPHAGESGLFGHEERRVIGPAVNQLRAQGIDADGPIPPDSAFTAKSLSRYDAFVCMYHDQGLIPFKMVSFDDGVNVTMGLPFVRTSVDHGTAYDLAGRGVAGITSLVAAVKLAAQLATKLTG
ncbi:4-hydroxythreonine-4-phosphate dehydrogenase PdxA [Candidatus Sumerlaeota bacterium]|nr:4-hydroxythreonine-4-phosphate dehydrogenase PdxA [Candidatus Sumerlaeota bacterium]